MEIIKIAKRDKLKKVQEEINKYIEDLEKENDELREKIRTYNKDTEIQKMNNEISHIKEHSLHISSNQERENINVFSQNHYEKCGSDIDITITGTSIGNILKVKCNKCGEKENVTDLNNW